MNDDYVIGTKLSEKKHLATKEKGPSATYKSLKEQLQHTQVIQRFQNLYFLIFSDQLRIRTPSNMTTD